MRRRKVRNWREEEHQRQLNNEIENSQTGEEELELGD